MVGFGLASAMEKKENLPDASVWHDHHPFFR
jgi:hypothetical protein